jgi:hypothetical protein
MLQIVRRSESQINCFAHSGLRLSVWIGIAQLIVFDKSRLISTPPFPHLTFIAHTLHHNTTLTHIHSSFTTCSYTSICNMTRLSVQKYKTGHIFASTHSKTGPNSEVQKVSALYTSLKFHGSRSFCGILKSLQQMAELYFEVLQFKLPTSDGLQLRISEVFLNRKVNAKKSVRSSFFQPILTRMIKRNTNMT